MPSVAADWDINRFTTALFNYIKDNNKFEWNPQLAHKGATRNDRR
jgi:hypothetical protein